MDAVSASSLPAGLPIGMETTQQVFHLCSDRFVHASSRRRQAVWSSPFSSTPLLTSVSHADNQQSQRDILTSTSASHNMAIADWVKSKMTVIASAQTVALSDDPVPVFKQLAQAGGFTNVYVGYASKTAKFSEPAGVPADYDPTIRPWYQQVVSTDGPVVTAPYVDAGTGKLVVTFAVPVKENGALKAVVAGDVAMDSVVANVRGIHPTPSSSGLLLNSDGSVIAANDPALTLKPFAETIKGIDFAALKSGNLVDGTLNDVEKPSWQPPCRAQTGCWSSPSTTVMPPPACVPCLKPRRFRW